MNQKQFTLYDSAVKMVMTCLEYCSSQHEIIYLDEINLKDSGCLCILAIGDVWSRAYSKILYVHCNIWQFLYLRYIKKFKGLKRIKIPSKVTITYSPYSEPYPIIVSTLVGDLMDYFRSELLETDQNLFNNIYNTYYNRRTQNG